MATHVSKNPHMKKSYSHSYTIFLHLLPGLFATVLFVFITPLLMRFGIPSVLSFFFIAICILIPFELGFVLYQAKKRTGTFCIQEIIPYRQNLPLKEYLIFGLLLTIWAIASYFFISTYIDQYLLKTCFSWLPKWFFLNNIINDVSLTSRSLLFTTIAIGLIFNGMIGPIIEELYFRGILLPRLSYLNKWAPMVNMLLFSVYHFMSPWQNPSRIIALLPMVYAVWWKKNIFLGIWVHCVINFFGMVLMTIGILSLM